MMRLLAGLLVAGMLAAGCSDKNSVPQGVLSHEKMEAVMWDIIQAEQYSGTYLAKDSARLDLKLENLRLYDEVFRLHKVSRDEFRKSYQYYMSRADVAQVLFDSLRTRGDRLRSENYAHPRPIATPPAPAPSPATPATAPSLHPATIPNLRPGIRDSFSRRSSFPVLRQKRLDSIRMHTKKPI